MLQNSAAVASCSALTKITYKPYVCITRNVTGNVIQFDAVQQGFLNQGFLKAAPLNVRPQINLTVLQKLPDCEILIDPFTTHDY